MTFHSIPFLLFVAFAAAVYYALPHRIRWFWLLLASCAFYASFVPAFLITLGALTILNYALGLVIGSGSERKARFVYISGLVANTGVLVYFKYSPFFDDCVSATARFLGFRYSEGAIATVLPLGLSFFVFTAISYLSEIRKGTVPAERHLGILALHFLFFPKVTQGPIERPESLIHQFREPHRLDADVVSDGLKLMLIGYFKKLVVADRLALYVNAVYGKEEFHNGTSLLIASIFYAFQIYADFSGYTDIARGCGRLFGFRLAPNFNRPYFATSIREFWNRWHISLSTWLRDYLFMPLAYSFSRIIPRPRWLGIRSDKWVYLFAAFITFLICGAWHGETLNFVLWGAVYGFYLTFSNWSRKTRRRFSRAIGLSKRQGLRTAWKVLCTFSLVTIAWVLFRGGSMDSILSILGKIFTEPGTPFLNPPTIFAYSVIAILALIVLDAKEEYGRLSFSLMGHRTAAIRYGTYALATIVILLLGVLDGGQFIYFQF